MPCSDCGSDKIEAFGRCASCNSARRKAERESLKQKSIHKIKKVSEKLKPKLELYSKQRKDHLKRHPYCQIRLKGCTGRAFQVHHSAKRGKNLNNIETFMSACDWCHDIVEFKMSAAERRERGLLK